VERTVGAFPSNGLPESGRSIRRLLSELSTAGRLPAGTSAHIRARGIGVVLGGRPVLSEVDVTVSHRSRMAVVGENGGGKTTLLRVLSGDLVPDKGRVERAGTAGPVHQSLGVHAGETVGTLVAESVRLPRLALRALDAATAALPVQRMSQGQRRRLHLALCLAEQPDLLILDEPTNHLSSPLVDELTAALRGTPAAVVVATHDRQMLADLASWPSLSIAAVPGTGLSADPCHRSVAARQVEPDDAAQDEHD